MYHCIVAPVDGSAFGEHALPVAASIAKRSGATLHLAHVHVPLIVPSGVETVAFRGGWMELTKAEEQHYLESLGRQVGETYGVQVQCSLVEGPVAEALTEHARGCGAGLVVMSTHGYVRFRRLWHHGVAEHLARALPVPVLLVRPPHAEMEPDLARELDFGHILVPLDGTPYAEAIVQHAVALGRPFRGRYTLLRVVRPDPATSYSRLIQGVSLERGLMDRAQLAARQYLNSMAERLRAAGLDVRIQVVASHSPAEAILDCAASSAGSFGPVDLIAMETHPHRPAARILSAHTADWVLHRSPVPVLLFEPTAAMPARAAAAPVAHA